MPRTVLAYTDGPYLGDGGVDVAAYGIKLASLAPHDAALALSLTAQVWFGVKVIPVQRTVVATMGTRVNTAGATAVASYNGFAVYSDGATLTPLGSSADDTTLWTTTGWRSKSLVTPVTLQPGVPYWLAMMARCTTAPVVLQSSASNAGLLSGMPGGKTTGMITGQAGFASVTKSSLTDLASRPFIAAY